MSVRVLKQAWHAWGEWPFVLNFYITNETCATPARCARILQWQKDAMRSRVTDLLAHESISSLQNTVLPCLTLHLYYLNWCVFDESKSGLKGCNVYKTCCISHCACCFFRNKPLPRQTQSSCCCRWCRWCCCQTVLLLAWESTSPPLPEAFLDNAEHCVLREKEILKMYTVRRDQSVYVSFFVDA